MIFQKKIDRAFKKLHEEQEESKDEMPELEKYDFLAMVLAALITIVPVAIVVLGGIAVLGYFFLMH